MNTTVLILATYLAGAIAMWNFDRTTYVYTHISRLFYLLDAGAAVFMLFVMIWASANIKTP